MFPAIPNSPLSTFHETKPRQDPKNINESSLLKKKKKKESHYIRKRSEAQRPRLIFHETFEPWPPLARPAGKGIFRTVQSRWADILTASGYIPGQFHSRQQRRKFGLQGT